MTVRITKESKYQFKAPESDWGFTDFMPLTVLYNPSEGFLKNDTLVIEGTDSTKEASNLDLHIDGGKTDEGEPSIYGELRELKNHVFGQTTQKPHYAPLDKYGDIIRDGMKIGLSIAFINLKQEIPNLKDTQSFWFKLDGFKNQLIMLEEMGFNMDMPKEQLQTLETIAEREHREARGAVEKFKFEMNEYEKKIIELKAEIDIRKKESDDALKAFESTAKRNRDEV